MKALKIVGLGLFILFLHASILGIPFADMQTCELPNGEKIKIRTTENWYLLKGLNPHGTAWGDRKRKVWYSPKGWFESNVSVNLAGPNVEDSRQNCVHYRLFGGVLDLAEAGTFNVHTNNILRLNYERSQSLLHPFINLTNANSKNVLFAELISNLEKLNLKPYRAFFMFDNNFLYYEAALIQKNVSGNTNHQDSLIKCKYSNIDDCTPVLSVWQSHSIDGGKTWTKPIITKDAKLFVIGKSVKEQPGVAKDKGVLRYIGWF